MAPRWWLLLLCLAGSILQARAQPDNRGFISIDCGLQKVESYVDNKTNLLYVSDAGFTDTGTNYNILAEYSRPWFARQVHSLRSFPAGVRNCYTLLSLKSGLKYLFRATFLYGNYDGLNKRPASFDLYIGVNFWTVVNMSWWGSDQGDTATVEAIVVVPTNVVHVCLVNTGGGTPFISGLEVRPLKMSLYPQANAELGLVLLGRRNFGPINRTIIRYPDDPYDRLWKPIYNDTAWVERSTTQRVDSFDGDSFEVPMKVLQMAITPLNASEHIELYWLAEPQLNNPSPGYLAVFHFTELQRLDRNTSRQFYINLNDEPWYLKAVALRYLSRQFIYNNFPNPRESRYDISIKATTNSTLPPIINAVEVFSVINTPNLGTDFQDASAAMAIKAKYNVQNHWMGDPCLPNNGGA